MFPVDQRQEPDEHRRIRVIERLGWLLFLVDALLPTFSGWRALLTLPDLPRINHIALTAVLLLLRLALTLRAPGWAVGASGVCVLVFMLATTVNWLLFSPVFQGHGRFVDQQWAEVRKIEDGNLDLTFEDGSSWQGKGSDADQTGIAEGMCLTVEVFSGRLGVRWIDFVPHFRPDGRPKIGGCFDSPALENVRRR